MFHSNAGLVLIQDVFNLEWDSQKGGSTQNSYYDSIMSIKGVVDQTDNLQDWMEQECITSCEAI